MDCACVCFLPIHSGHQVRWTYQPGSHRRKDTQEEGHTGFLIHLLSAVRALIFLARRIQLQCSNGLQCNSNTVLEELKRI